MTPSFGGLYLFGEAVHIEHTPNANAQQIAAFFGVTGVQSMTGGGRGRAFMIQGVLPGLNPALCVEAELYLLQFADGIARSLIDTVGIVWPNVVFHAEYQRVGGFLVNCTGGGWLLPYRCVMHGLT